MELSKTKASILSSLASKKMREKYGLFMAEGVKCALDTLGAFDLSLLIVTPEWLKHNGNPPGIEDSKIVTASKEMIKKISSLSTPSELVAIFHLPEKMILCEHLDAGKLYLMLDGVQDPGNLGTIIRTADWFGIEKIICSHDTVDVFNPKTVQATMGSLKRVDICYGDLSKIIKENNPKHVYGTLLEGEDIFEANLSSSGVIVMGSEGRGLSENMRSLVTHPLYIPPTRRDSHPDSLNVAIATAITLAQFRK